MKDWQAYEDLKKKIDDFTECVPVLEASDWPIALSIDWLIDWSSDWLMDWLIDWLIYWLIDRLIDWLINRFIDLVIDWLIDWPIALSIYWSIDWLIDWFTDKRSWCHLIFSLTSCLFIWKKANFLFLQAMTNKAMKDRHWVRISDLTQFHFDMEMDGKNLLLKDIMKAPILKYKDEIEVCRRHTFEKFSFRTSITTIDLQFLLCRIFVFLRRRRTTLRPNWRALLTSGPRWRSSLRRTRAAQMLSSRVVTRWRSLASARTAWWCSVLYWVTGKVEFEHGPHFSIFMSILNTETCFEMKRQIIQSKKNVYKISNDFKLPQMGIED